MLAEFSMTGRGKGKGSDNPVNNICPVILMTIMIIIIIVEQLTFESLLKSKHCVLSVIRTFISLIRYCHPVRSRNPSFTDKSITAEKR